MVPPMQAALTDPRQGDSAFLRQVVFLTDGAIGNEQQLLETIGALRGRSRLFMVGIGSAPNSFLMTRAAEIGRGTFTHIGAVEQIEQRMRALFEKLESPVVTNLTATFSHVQADVTPALLPDVYRGEPVVLAARLAAFSGTVEIRGRIGDQPWMVTMPLAHAAEGKGLSKLWARRKIDDAEAARILRRLKPEESVPHPDTRARPSSGDAADQPGGGRPDAEPPGRRAPCPRRPAAQPAGRLGLRQGVRRAACAGPAAD
jgi:Ca-activated chloride channel homolog